MKTYKVRVRLIVEPVDVLVEATCVEDAEHRVHEQFDWTEYAPEYSLEIEEVEDFEDE